MEFTEKHKQTLLVGSILGGTILIILVYLGFMIVKPKVSEMNEQIAKAGKELRDVEKTLKLYDEYLTNEAARLEVERAFGRVARRLPRVSDPIEVFDLLRDYIEGTDVTFTFLEPGRLKTRQRYTEYPFTLRGSARYHQFGQLINLVECNPDRLMRVTNFKLTNNDKRPSIHPMELGIETYTFNDR